MTLPRICRLASSSSALRLLVEEGEEGFFHGAKSNAEGLEGLVEDDPVARPRGELEEGRVDDAFDLAAAQGAREKASSVEMLGMTRVPRLYRPMALSAGGSAK